MKKECVNRLDVTLDQEERNVLYRCAEILHEMANSAEDEGLTTLMYGGVKYNAYEWLHKIYLMLEHFSDIKTISFTK